MEMKIDFILLFVGYDSGLYMGRLLLGFDLTVDLGYYRVVTGNKRYPLDFVTIQNMQLLVYGSAVYPCVLNVASSVVTKKIQLYLELLFVLQFYIELYGLSEKDINY